MSRSIHTTRRSVRELDRARYSNPDEKQDALDSAQQDLNKKRLIKRQISEGRGQAKPPLIGSPLEHIPIEFLDTNQYVHHVVREADLRSVLKGLPPSATEGISRIQLGLGKEYIESSNDDDEPGRDPYTDRISSECLPGVWAGQILGTYRPTSGLIKLYAYVFDENEVPLPGNLRDLYLRIQTLSTFVHEVAHHHDQLCRVGRGRWLAERYGLVEWYAEKMEHEWMRKVVLPYLEEAFPNDVRELVEWVEHHGGIKLPLEFFAGDSRTTQKDGGDIIRFETSSAFESLVEDVAKAPTLEASRLNFAWELHYADEYDHCLKALDGILAENPTFAAALVCKADTLVHLDRMDEAMELAEIVLATEPGNLDAIEIRGDVFEDRQEWQGLIQNSQEWLAKSEEDSSSQRGAYMHLAIACCGKGDFEQMEKWIQVRAAYDGKPNPTRIRKSVYRRAGQVMPDQTQ